MCLVCGDRRHPSSRPSRPNESPVDVAAVKRARAELRTILPAALAMFGLTLLMAALFIGLDRSKSVMPAEVEQAAAVPLGSPMPLAATAIRAVWANDGGEKIYQEERPALERRGDVINSVWDGERISLFGAANETVSFALILETGARAAEAVEVTLARLEGRHGAVISSRAPKDTPYFPDIELFHVGYLQLKGLSKGLAWDTYDERHLPRKCRRPHDADGEGRGGWRDRPCADRHIPDIAVPLALTTPFSIAAGRSQTLWVDIYIPKDAKPGRYRGEVVVSEKGKRVWRLPVTLEVLPFVLPDRPTARTMLAITTEDIAERYLGNAYPDPGTPAHRKLQRIIDRHYQLAHRHRISLVEGYTPLPLMDRLMLPRLDGSLFTAARGYRGPGEGVGNNVYAVGLFGFWPWKSGDRNAMWRHADAWVEWFRKRGLTDSTEFFLYLDDESKNSRQLERWARWLRENPGPGHALPSMATVDLLVAAREIPSLSIVATLADFGLRDRRERAARRILDDPERKLYLYNGRRPATGSFALEDDGTALRQLAWAQYKKGIDRWFYWNATYYNNTQCNDGRSDVATDVYRQARTFGCRKGGDPLLGERGYNYFNGDGVLFYPGTDRRFPASAPSTAWPVPSLRLKQWRRGLQDVEYLALAEAVDPAATRRILQRMVPKVLWEYGVTSRRDPTWVRADISWPDEPDAWEEARRALAAIIVAGVEDDAFVKPAPERPK